MQLEDKDSKRFPMKKQKPSRVLNFGLARN